MFLLKLALPVLLQNSIHPLSCFLLSFFKIIFFLLCKVFEITLIFLLARLFLDFLRSLSVVSLSTLLVCIKFVITSLYRTGTQRTGVRNRPEQVPDRRTPTPPCRSRHPAPWRRRRRHRLLSHHPLPRAPPASLPTSATASPPAGLPCPRGRGRGGGGDGYASGASGRRPRPRRRRTTGGGAWRWTAARRDPLRCPWRPLGLGFGGVDGRGGPGGRL